MKIKKILFLIAVLGFGFITLGSAENILNLGDFLTVYFEGSSPEISNNWQNIDVKYKNVTKKSPLYKSIQKGIYLDMIPNIDMEIPLDIYLTQDKIIRLLDITQNTNFDYIKGKKVDKNRVKYLISKNLEDFIMSKNITKDIKNKLEENYIYQNKLKNRYIDARNIAGSIDKMNDEYTVFFPPQDARNFDDNLNGSFEGIGAYIDMIKPGKIIISSPIRNSPAEKYGIEAGDIVLRVGDNTVTKKTGIQELINWIKGPIGTYVDILIERGSNKNYKRKMLRIKRGKIVLPNVEFEILKGSNCYISINQFNWQSRIEFKKAIDYFDNKSCEKYILDVRGNPGGVLDDVGYMLNYFVPDRKTAILIKYKDNETKMVASDKTRKLYNKDVVILVDGGSASASEIFAGVIRDYVHHSILLGSKTFGKGSVQGLINYKNGAMLKYTIAKRYTGGSKKNIDGIGFIPDLKIEDNLNTKIDEVLEVAKIYKFE